MTYFITINGHGDESYEKRRATEQRLVKGLVAALEDDGGNVTTFLFQGNEVQAKNFEEARAIAAESSS